eukprot:4186431-Alexandrium_andersonii.AAC.1
MVQQRAPPWKGKGKGRGDGGIKVANTPNFFKAAVPPPAIASRLAKMRSEEGTETARTWT